MFFLLLSIADFPHLFPPFLCVCFVFMWLLTIIYTYFIFLQLDNGIPIESWFEDRGDTELLKLSAFLHQLLVNGGDVRPLVREKFRVHRLVEDAR